MNDPHATLAPDLGGEIRILLGGEVRILAARPQLAQRLLAGRTAAQAAGLIGRLYAVCGQAQRVACEAATHAALGVEPPPIASERRARRVLAELAREHVLHLGSWGGTPPDSGALAALLRAGDDAAALASALDRLLRTTLLGEAPAAWLARDLDALGEWWRRGGSGPARCLAQLMADPEPQGACLPWLPPIAVWRPEEMEALARMALEEPRFCTAPLWRGSPAETGALARLAHAAQAPVWLSHLGRGSAARLLARLEELARLPGRLLQGGPAVVRTFPLEEGLGAAGVETARGLLLHVVRLRDGRVTDYRILAPTEWNFHPRGPLAQALKALPADARRGARARRLAASLDPCVACRVEDAHA